MTALYAHRAIDISIELGEGEFGEKKGKTTTISGSRVSAVLQAIASDAQQQAQIRVSGLSLDLTNKLTGEGPAGVNTRRDRVLVAVGDVGGVMSTAFTGAIRYSYGDFQSAPDVGLNIIAFGAGIEALRPVNATSYRGSVDVATIMENLAAQMGPQPGGLAFDNSGDVHVMLSNPYLKGTALNQVKSAARAADINYTVEKGKLVIWPKNGHRREDPVKISAETGMIGYPAFGGFGIIVNSLYQPTVAIGSRIEVKSTITVACGVWTVYSATHVLQSEMPGGKWLSQLMCKRNQL